jgi:hypothetical protein
LPGEAGLLGIEIMNPSDILLLGLNKHVTAFHRANGTVLWKTKLPDSSAGAFVTVISDSQRVYACCMGAITCLDLFSGEVLWADPLRGYGYGISGLCLPEMSPGSQAAAAAQVAEEARRQSASAAT